MDVQETRLQQVLEGAKQYRVPLYQRPYSWTAKQLDRLWSDVVDLAEQRVDTPGATHFTGSLVLSLGEIGPAGSQFLVVDGQQRLTTLSLFICALRDHYAETEPKYPEKVQRLEETYLFDRFKRGDDRLKVLPTQADRQAFRAIVDGNIDQSVASGVLDAYRFFRTKLHGADDPDDAYDMDRIESVVLNGLVFVSITAHAHDNVYRIFESLNNTGLKLTQGDLLRNYIFMRLGSRSEEIYDSWWLPLQKALSPADLEALFWIDLIWSTPDAKQGDIYSLQVDRMRSLTEDQIVAEVRRYSGLAQLLAVIRNPENEPDPDVRAALQRNVQWGLSATDALVLHLLRLRDAGSVSSSEVAESLRLLESFMVRRVIIGASSAALSRILYRAPLEVGESDVAATLHRYFSVGRKFFATDAQIREAVLSKPFYYQGRPAQRKMILAWLEDVTPIEWRNRDVSAKEHTDPSAATIEHVMPQTLSQTWREALADDLETFDTVDEMHESYVHTLANLTLTSYNSELSNRPFSEKRQLLDASSFRLNREIAGQTAWTRRQIVERGSVIADRIISTWAAPLADTDSGGSRISWKLVLDLVAAIPPGRWASYGDIATVAGTHPVPLGQFLIHAPAPNAYRVLKQSGQISPGFVWGADSPHADVAPEELLASEGVAFDSAGRADLRHKLTVPELAELVGLSIHSDIDFVPDEGNSERAEFLAGLADRQAPSTVHGVVELLDEWERLGGILDFGAAEEKSCFLVARGSAPASKSIWPLTLYPSGSVEVVFQHMRSRPPFDSLPLRQALLSRLNTVSGVDLPADRLEKRPSFDLEVLAHRSARRQLVEVLEWFVGELTAHDNSLVSRSG
ncbi:hypothetical protein C5C99_00420 [Rathayibacter sp. AY1C4]|uniref:GmrSD restriction endonuclease domain-containing protein n=1 Tax=Rathayibacter sp. AY1C4 TaxID=2080537 RepID=UPI000CE91756|nr:DUF262 domain-containing protein [Rathayibacter sp. AY1C4]PPH24149.1 hypothetical protein C5C99_00420 [Rathayibacter sp. AY1C4]